MRIGAVVARASCVLDLDHLARARAAPAAPRRDVLGALDALRARALAQRLDARADALGDAQPGEAERQRDAGHQRGDPQHARAGEAEQLHARPARARSRARRRHGRRQPRLRTGTGASTRARRWRTAAAPGRARTASAAGVRRRAGGSAHRRAAAAPARRARRAAPTAQHHQTEIAEQEEADVGEPGAERAGPVARPRRRAARSRRPGRPRCAWPAPAARAASSTAPTSSAAAHASAADAARSAPARRARGGAARAGGSVAAPASARSDPSGNVMRGLWRRPRGAMRAGRATHRPARSSVGQRAP